MGKAAGRFTNRPYDKRAAFQQTASGVRTDLARCSLTTRYSLLVTRYSLLIEDDFLPHTMGAGLIDGETADRDILHRVAHGFEERHLQWIAATRVAGCQFAEFSVNAGVIEEPLRSGDDQ